MENFLPKMAVILEVDQVKPEDSLESFECWDSLTILSIIAMVDESYQVPLSAEDVKKALTIGGLQEVIESKTLN